LRPPKPTSAVEPGHEAVEVRIRGRPPSFAARALPPRSGPDVAYRRGLPQSMAALLPSNVLPRSMAICEVAKLLETKSKKILNANTVLSWRWLLYQTELQNCSHMHSTFCLSKMHMLVSLRYAHHFTLIFLSIISIKNHINNN
jgi:hypothetical protein